MERFCSITAIDKVSALLECKHRKLLQYIPRAARFKINQHAASKGHHQLFF
jgi:hypothetical protein